MDGANAVNTDGTNNTVARTLIVAALCATSFVLVLAGQAGQGALLFEGARLVTGNPEASIESSAFLVENGRFTRVGRKGEIRLQASATRVDLTARP